MVWGKVFTLPAMFVLFYNCAKKNKQFIYPSFTMSQPIESTPYKFRTPMNTIVVGASQSGKTTFVRQLLSHPELFDQPIDAIHWHHGIETRDLPKDDARFPASPRRKHWNTLRKGMASSIDSLSLMIYWQNLLLIRNCSLNYGRVWAITVTSLFCSYHNHYSTSIGSLGTILTTT